jgi:two-component system chemotaxis response regulator CheB
VSVKPEPSITQSFSDRPTRILIIDDSALYRQAIQNALHDMPEVSVIGVAKNGIEALEKIDELDPDLLTLDIQMPDMDGITTLREINRRKLRPTAIMVSSLTHEGAQITTDALLEGAFDFILKPSGGDAQKNHGQLREELTKKITAFRAMVAAKTRRYQIDVPERKASPGELRGKLSTKASVCRAVLIATSTGGPAALKVVLPKLPANIPVPILVVQHMPPKYTHSLAKRLDELCEVKVKEAKDLTETPAGTVLIAPGGQQMRLAVQNSHVVTRITNDPAENGCRPSADYLFRSCINALEGNVLAVIMTGMGRDGTNGCIEIKRHGGNVFAQHQNGCAVYGMPKATIDQGLADRVLPLGKIGPAIVRHIKRSRRI